MMNKLYRNPNLKNNIYQIQVKFESAKAVLAMMIQDGYLTPGMYVRQR